MPIFVGCFIVRSSWLDLSLSCFKSLLGSLPISILPWQLPRQFTLVWRCCEKRRGHLLSVRRVASLGREVFILVLGWPHLVVKLLLTLWFGSENQSKTAVLSQVSQSLVVKLSIKFEVRHFLQMRMNILRWCPIPKPFAWARI